MSLLEKFEKFVILISKWFNVIAGIGIVAMLVLVTADIIGNKVFKYPIPGGIEFVTFIAVVAIAFAIAQTQLMRGHIEVEFIVDRMPPPAQRIISIIIYIFSMILFILLAWRSFIYANELMLSGEVSMTRGIPFYPFVYMLGLCSIVVFLVLLLQFIKTIKGR